MALPYFPPQEIIIVASYGAVAIFGFYGAWLSKSRRVHGLAWLLLGIANIFVFCDINYLLHAFHADKRFIDIEHYFVAAGGTLAAISMNPWFIRKFLDERKALEDGKKMTDLSRQLSGFCWVVLEWESDSIQTIVDINYGMIQWVTRKGFAAPDALAIGNNWLSIFPHESEWLDRHRETALGGRTWRNMETTHTFENGSISSLNWTMYLFSPSYLGSNPKIVIEWFDSTNWLILVKNLGEELKKEQDKNKELEVINAGLNQKNKTEVLTRLERISKKAQNLGILKEDS